MTGFDCQETKRHVHEFLQQELSEAEMQQITDHLANCDSCDQDYDFEQVFNSAIQRSCTEDSPDELAQRVLDKIRALQSGKLADEALANETIANE